MKPVTSLTCIKKESVGYYHACLLLSLTYVWYNTQDGSYNYVDFTSTFEEYEIQRVMRAYENSITINLHCCAEGDWQQEHINKEQFSEFCQVKYKATIFTGFPQGKSQLTTEQCSSSA